MNLSSLGIRSSHSLFNMVNLGLWQEGGKKTHSFPPLKVNKQGKHCHSHANGPCRRQIFSALSYLIHSSPRQRSEWLLCSNPPLLIPPSLHPSLLHTSPLPRSITGYYLGSAGPCIPARFPLEFKKKKSRQSSQSSNFGHFQAFSESCPFSIQMMHSRWMFLESINRLSHKKPQRWQAFYELIIGNKNALVLRYLQIFAKPYRTKWIIFPRIIALPNLILSWHSRRSWRVMCPLGWITEACD